MPAQHFEGFDPEGYSIWFCEYKYPEENTVNYIVMNKVRSPCCTARPNTRSSKGTEGTALMTWSWKLN